MIVTIFGTMTFVLWVIFCIVVYVWHYFIEVVLDLPISGQSPCTAHASLKQLIQRFIQEASELPPLRVRQLITDDDDNGTNRTYEDLLSTAIINKVIQNYQESLPTTSSRSSNKSTIPEHLRKKDSEYYFGEETLDNKWKNSDDATSQSSIDCLRSESSISLKCYDDLSLTIQQRIEEVSSPSSSSEDEREEEEDESSDWHENWYLKKRQFNGTHSPVPVPMLVPNPTVETKVLIGDRDAEDTTDLSDAASDYGDVEIVPGVKSVLVDSKTIIGGKNVIGQIEETVAAVTDDVEITEDGSTDTSDLIQEREDVLKKFVDSEMTETKNDVLIGNSSIEDNSLTSLDSNVEQNLEHTERYATLPRQIAKTPEPKPRITSAIDDAKEKDADLLKTSDDFCLTNGKNDLSDIFKGSYSVREKEKWKKPIQMDNNPYTKENIDRRLSSRSNSSTGSNNNATNNTYDRDYYIRHAGKSAGATEKLATKLKEEELKQSPAAIIIDDNEEETAIKKIEPIEEMKLVRAMPVLVNSWQSDTSFNNNRPNSLDILSSDSDLSSIERSYNPTTGKVTKKIPEIHKEILAGAKSPEGMKNLTDLDDNNNNENIIDENFNNDHRKVPFINEEEAEESFSLSYSDENDFCSLNDGLLTSKRINSRDLSKSAPNIFVNEIDETNESNAVVNDNILPVSKLTRLFEMKSIKNNSKETQNVHSLTARSIPNQVRRELKGDEGSVETNVLKPEGNKSNDVVEEIEEIQLPSVKNRKEFFEKKK